MKLQCTRMRNDVSEVFTGVKDHTERWMTRSKCRCYVFGIASQQERDDAICPAAMLLSPLFYRDIKTSDV